MLKSLLSDGTGWRLVVVREGGEMGLRRLERPGLGVGSRGKAASQPAGLWGRTGFLADWLADLHVAIRAKGSSFLLHFQSSTTQRYSQAHCSDDLQRASYTSLYL